MMIFGKSLELPTKENALPGRSESMDVPKAHAVLGSPLVFPNDTRRQIWFAMGCFWGAERLFWQIPGVISTSVGYAGGLTPNPTYKEVCSGQTGHTEVVKVYFDPKKVSLESLLKVFWEKHDPTAGMRQGNDVGTQYRSAIFCEDQNMLDTAHKSKSAFQKALNASNMSAITTTVEIGKDFFYAEEYHQQYLAKNPNGYCGIRGTGVECQI